MFKAIFEFLIDPLGLPVEWYWEYVILAVVGIVAYKIAYRTVGDMYSGHFIGGRWTGSFFHWLIRLLIFVVIWAVTYGAILFGKFIIANWQMILMVLGGIAGFVALCALAIFLLRKIRKSKAVSKNA